ncbi:hypothetical protein LTR65_007491 [Meristemomyces frigidus]
MTIHSFWRRLAALAVSATAVYAQTSTPSRTWTGGVATCTNGLATPSSPGGTYSDNYGALWNVECGQDLTGAAYTNLGTNNQGIYSCFQNCDRLVGCTAFAYIGTVTGVSSGSGHCYHRTQAGSYYLNNTVYAAANLISNGTPQLPCPYYNGTTFTNSDGSVWQVFCGFDVSGTTISGGSPADMPGCMTACNALILEYVDIYILDGQAAGLLGTFTDTCGYNYTIYCTTDNNPSSVYSIGASSFVTCMRLCDNYSGCRSASFDGNTCYIKTGFTGLTTSTNANLGVLVKYIPPNPAYPSPLPAPGTNTSSGCGTSLPAGVTPDGASTTFSFVNPSDQVLRNWTIHIPRFYNINSASPLIFAFPGNGETATNIEGETGLDDSIVNPYAVVAYVNGYALGFASNPAYSPQGQYSFVDDIGFIQALITNITSSYCIDTGRIFATGHSNGGGFCGVLACHPTLSNTFAAFAPNSGAFYTNNTGGSQDPTTVEPVNTPVEALCLPGRNNVPILEFHGTNDGTISYLGTGNRGSPGKVVPSIPHWVQDWVLRQGYDSTNYTTSLTSLNVYMQVTRYQFGGDAGQLGIITHYMLSNWTHNWPNPASTSSSPLNAAPIVMDFFYRWTNTTRPPTYNPLEHGLGVFVDFLGNIQYYDGFLIVIQPSDEQQQLRQYAIINA